MLSSIQSNTLNLFQKMDGHFQGNIAKIGAWLDKHPKVNTIVIIANHIFRALGMVALMSVFPGSFAVKCAILLGASLFYRITIERFCHFRFAIPSCLGAIAFELSLPAFANLVNGVASKSFFNLAQTSLGVSSLALYFVGVVWISHSAIQELVKIKKEPSKSNANPSNQPNCCCETP